MHIVASFPSRPSTAPLQRPWSRKVPTVRENKKRTHSELTERRTSDIRSFAALRRLKVVRHEDGDLIVRGRFGHIYQHDTQQLGIVFLGDADDTSKDNTLRSRIRRALREGFDPHQVADFEAVLLFDVSDVRLGKLAIRLVGCKRRRRHRPPTRRQLEALRKGWENHRIDGDVGQEGHDSTQNGPNSAAQG